MNKLKAVMAGDIILADNPGEMMRKWREIFEIYQSDLAKYLKVSPSTISDYESGRRPNPGIKIVKRFVDTLFEIDMSRGGKIIKRLLEGETNYGEYFEVHEFSVGLSLAELAKILDAKIVTNEDKVKDTKIYGYVLLHSIRVMLDMPEELFKILGMHAVDKAFIFLEVSSGRSPLVVVRIAENKPKLVVLHGLDKVDELAKKISERQKIPIFTTKVPVEEMKKKLNL